MNFDFIALVSVLSAISGAGAYLNSVRKTGIWSWFALLAELTLSLSVGLGVGYFSLSMEWSKELAFFLVIVAANNADEAVSTLREVLSAIIEKKVGITLKKED